ncbi:DUF4350 domain-containing protein [Natrinema sp. 1APR25-10V2]|uniref:DUF4350 domain-containing protein n=1 Tax=Natrinema sp. 1APR25-10V2 TaxID=2951081 RepID=UPI0028756484|nr:DUF4350 domain-containing protein [Natrinema sp. 1APR25-10V2]MDS0475731.1 DUF4350 domain-containing protein [Natrinema sp. 1APR25-10V2]
MRSLRALVDDGGRIDWPRVLLLGLVVTVVLALGTVAATSSTAFGLYNPSWDGSSEFRQDVESHSQVERHLLRDTTRYENFPANETVAFVIAPNDPYEGEDLEHVQEFVARGGTLVVLENFGEPGAALLADLETEARPNGQVLRDERHHFRGPAMPVAPMVKNHTRTAGVDRLTLNYATAIDPGNATVLVATSEFAYLGPEDEELDDQDELRSYPVATIENVSDGHVVVVGDPSLTINTMYDEPDNAAFVRGLYADADHVVFDHSHAAGVPPLTGLLLAIRASPLLQVLVGSIGIGIVTLGSYVRGRSAVETIRSRLPARFRPAGSQSTETGASGPGLADAERAAYLRNRHPDWDEERIQRVITALNHPQSEEEADE